MRLFPSQQVALGLALAESLAAIYQWRPNDGMLAPGPIFVPGTAPGDYQLTTPGPPQPVNTGAAS